MTSHPPAARATAQALPVPRAHRAGVLAVTALVAAALVAWAAPAPTAAAAAPASDAWVRAAHLVPGLGAMDISVTPVDRVSGEAAEGAEPAVELAFGATYGAVGEYEALPPGAYVAELRTAGADPSSEPLLTTGLEARAGAASTVAGLGTTDSPRLAVLSDDLTPPSPGTARVRLLPAAQSSPTVDVTAVDGPVVARGAAFGRPTGYAEVPAGPWTLDAVGEGTRGTTEVQMEAGTVYTLLVLDGDDGLRLQGVVDAAGTTTTPVGGAATGTGAVEPAAAGTTSGPALVGAGAALLLAVGAAGVVVRRRRA